MVRLLGLLVEGSLLWRPLRAALLQRAPRLVLSSSTLVERAEGLEIRSRMFWYILLLLLGPTKYLDLKSNWGQC